MTVETVAQPAAPETDPREADLETLRGWMLDGVMNIYAYVRTPGFQAVLAEMNTLGTLAEKDRFVRTVLLDPEQLALRGITPPPGMTVQRSRFHDARPTVFCVVTYLPDPTRKMTITFDQGALLWPTEY